MTEQSTRGAAWAAFDLMRIVAAIALVAICVFGDSRSQGAVALGTFVVTGVLVSVVRHYEAAR